MPARRPTVRGDRPRPARGGLRSSPVRGRFLAAPLLAASLLCAPEAAPAQEPDEPGRAEEGAVVERCRGSEHRQFDFWIGVWEVRSPDGAPLGRNEIRRESGGCALLERWQGAAGGVGVSINTWDPDLGRWTQRWVGAGATLWLEGGLEAGPDGPRMVLASPRPRETPQGSVLDRITWTPLPDGRVRQVWEVSVDDGASWDEVFRGFYTRVPGDGGGRG